MQTPQIMKENGKRYRMLQVGETIEEGDEVKMIPEGWTEYYAFGGAPDCPPVVMEPSQGFRPQGYYRREIKP